MNIGNVSIFTEILLDLNITYIIFLDSSNKTCKLKSTRKKGFNRNQELRLLLA